MTFPASTTSSTSRKNVLLLTRDIEGPVRNGGIGTAFTALARALVAAGHRVTIFYTRDLELDASARAHWAEYYKKQGIHFFPMFKLVEPDAMGIPEPRRDTWRVYTRLRDHGENFDVVYCPEWRGEAYYALLARRQGLHFQKTSFVVVTHSPSAWAQEGNYQLPSFIDDVETEFLEQQSIALADQLISPSEYMLSWLQRRNWAMPDNRRVLPNCVPANLKTSVTPSAPINELVFFGRLEERKGLTLFFKALDRLNAETWANIRQITFLGKKAEHIAFDNLVNKSKHNNWSAPVKLLTDMDRTGANAYLSEPGRLAIIASLTENSPYSVMECLVQGTPFIASTVGGIPELVAPMDRERVLFDPYPQALASCIEKQLENEFSPAQAAFDRTDIARRWDELTAMLPIESPAPVSTDSPPHITVCLVHYERPLMLEQALKSLACQTYRNFDVIVVDDGSPSSTTKAYLELLEPELKHMSWQLVRSPNRYLGAARNLAASHARGEYVMFMDDDNIALPHELETYARVARQMDADVLTCMFDVYLHPIHATERRKPANRWVSLGPCVSLGVFQNCYGDANALIRRSFFEKIGGFTEDYGIGHEDWEFFNTAMLHNARFHIVPEVLFLYRASPEGMLRQGDLVRNHSRNTRPLTRNAAGPSGTAMGYALSLHLRLCGYEQEQAAASMPLARHSFRQLARSLLDRRMFKVFLRDALQDRMLRQKFFSSLRRRGLRQTIQVVFRYTLHKVLMRS